LGKQTRLSASGTTSATEVWFEPCRAPKTCLLRRRMPRRRCSLMWIASAFASPPTVSVISLTPVRTGLAAGAAWDFAEPPQSRSRRSSTGGADPSCWPRAPTKSTNNQAAFSTDAPIHLRMLRISRSNELWDEWPRRRNHNRSSPAKVSVFCRLHRPPVPDPSSNSLPKFCLHRPRRTAQSEGYLCWCSTK